MTGPAEAPCSVLTTECAYGELEAQAGCCTSVPVPPGVPCNEGVCDGSGACDPDGKLSENVPEPHGVRGFAHWVRTHGSGTPTLWYHDDGVEVSLEGEPALRWTGEQLDLSTLHVVRGHGAVLGGVGVRAPLVGERQLFLPLDESGPASVCVLRGEPSDMSEARADCTGAAAQQLACPGEADGVDCRVQAGRVTVSGADVSGAFFPVAGDTSNVMPMLFPGWGFPRRCNQCRPGSLTPCRDSCGNTRFRTCNILGCLSACPSPQEVCNGRDDDCDGRVDEDPSALCDDGVSCTYDSCERDILTGRTSCNHEPWAFAFCRDDGAECSREFCGTAGDVAPGDEVTPLDANGCGRVLRHDWCTNDVDGCECNGPERCEPSATDPNPPAIRQPRDGRSNPITKGCVSAPQAEWPCERGDLCTIDACCLDMGSEACWFEMSPTEKLACAGPRDCPPWEFDKCETDNPCMAVSCDAAEGECKFEPVPLGVQCSGPTNRGCSQGECNGAGRCLQRPTGLLHGIGNECSGPNAGRNEKSCGHRQCSDAGGCEWYVDEPDLCGDHQYCNGSERCIDPDTAREEMLDVQTHRTARARNGELVRVDVDVLHCYPDPHRFTQCTDHVDCTLDTCDEDASQLAREPVCNHTPQHSACRANRDRSPCDFSALCEPDNPNARWGCVPIPSTRGGPCDDGVSCTDDTCTETGEFGTTFSCQNVYNPRRCPPRLPLGF